MVTQRQSIAFGGNVAALRTLLERIGGPGSVEVIEPDIKFKIFKSIDITVEGKVLILEWAATPISDMYADTVVASLIQTELVGNQIKATSAGTKPDLMHFKECLIETLQDMFGDSSVPKVMKGDSLPITVNDKAAEIDLVSLVRSALYQTTAVLSNTCPFFILYCRP